MKSYNVLTVGTRHYVVLGKLGDVLAPTLAKVLVAECGGHTRVWRGLVLYHNSAANREIYNNMVALALHGQNL